MNEIRQWVDVAPVGEFATAGTKVVEVDGTDVVVFALREGYYALEDCCSHEDATLSDGEVSGNEICCLRHGARFDIRTGEALTAPAYEAVPTFAVRVADGVVQVAVGGPEP